MLLEDKKKKKTLWLYLCQPASKMYFLTVIIVSPQRMCAGVKTGGRHKVPSPKEEKTGADTAEDRGQRWIIFKLHPKE